MKVLDLFSGIGGFSLGLEWAGMETIAFVEKEPYCQKILKQHWPDVPIYEDVYDRAIESIRGVDVITGGFPCQPFSVAGQQRGKEDDRYLWPRMLEIIKAHRPTWVIGENVTGIIPLALDQVLSNLEEQAYTTQTFIIPACGVNALHRRDRVWILGYSEKFKWYDRADKESVGELQYKKQVRRSGSHDVPHPYSKRLETRFPLPDRKTEGRTIDRQDGVSVQGPSQCRMEGERPKQQATGINEPIGSDRWSTQPGICGISYGVPDRVDRIKALGNAVVPQVVEQIGRAIMQAEEEA